MYGSSFGLWMWLVLILDEIKSRECILRNGANLVIWKTVVPTKAFARQSSN